MRITHVITRLIVGGAQENTIASVLGLRRKPGLDVDLLSGPSEGPEGSLESYFNSAVANQNPSIPNAAADKFPLLISEMNGPGARVSNQGEFPALTIIPSLTRPVHPFKDFLALQQLTRHFRQTQPVIVHTHSGKAGILGRRAAANARVPIIVHTIHGPSFGPFQGAVANWILSAAERRAGRVTTCFVSVADAMTRQYLAAGIGRPGQYTTIRSGFDLQPYLSATNDPALRKRLGLAPDDFVVGKIARLFKLKGHNDLFAVAPELVSRCPRIKFLLVGDGPWRGRFEKRAAESGLSRRFVFTGLVPPMDIPKLVGVMDAVVHLSLREGLPRALPQALAAGRPVVAYDCDGAREICRNEETGFLLPPLEVRALSARLLQLAGDPPLCARLGQHGRELVKKEFGVEKMVDDLHALYLRLVEEKKIITRF